MNGYYVESYEELLEMEAFLLEEEYKLSLMTEVE